MSKTSSMSHDLKTSEYEKLRKHLNYFNKKVSEWKHLISTYYYDSCFSGKKKLNLKIQTKTTYKF